MRSIGTFLIAVLLMATFARAGLPDMVRASCSGDLVSADVCQMPGLPVKTAKLSAKSCCAGLPDLPAQGLQAVRGAERVALVLARAVLLPGQTGGAGPWRPPRD